MVDADLLGQLNVQSLIHAFEPDVQAGTLAIDGAEVSSFRFATWSTRDNLEECELVIADYCCLGYALPPACATTESNMSLLC